MLYIAWDTETALFGPGKMAPPLACVSAKYEKGEGLIHWSEAEAFFDEVFYDPNYIHVGHNIAYDLAVVAAQWPKYLRVIFEMYEQGRVRDTLVRQKLLDISMGIYRGYHSKPTKKDLEEGRTRGKWVQLNYSLLDVCKRHTGRKLDKDTWQKKYGALRHLPLDQWPKGARKYPMDDARATWDVFWSQQQHNKNIIKVLREQAYWLTDPDPLADELFQCQAAFWLQLMSVWGIRTSAKRVRKFRVEVEKKFYEYQEELQKTHVCSHEGCGKLLKKVDRRGVGRCERHGVVQGDPIVRPEGSRDTKAAKRLMIEAMGGLNECRLTKTGQPSLNEEACKEADNPVLLKYSQLTALKNVVSKDIKFLMRGRFMPVHSSFNSLLATGRTSSSKPNIQNIRRLPGIRECFVPRRGHVFLDCDYDGLELRTLAQACLKIVGHSRLAEVLNAGKDPHTDVAAQIVGISYQEAVRRLDAGDSQVDEARQLAKIANFGFPGGMGVDSLLDFAKGFGKVGKNLTEKDVKRLKKMWLRTYPEMAEYFRHISNLCAAGGKLATIEQLFSPRIRADIKYTAACNTFFQGLGSDATKEAGWEIAKACYLDKGSVLYGCRIVNYIHDQFIVEAPEERAHEAVMELKRIMEKAASKWLPDVPATVKKPVICRRWSKKASQVRGPDGRLVPWDEAPKAA